YCSLSVYRYLFWCITNKRKYQYGIFGSVNSKCAVYVCSYCYSAAFYFDSYTRQRQVCFVGNLTLYTGLFLLAACYGGSNFCWFAYYNNITYNFIGKVKWR